MFSWFQREVIDEGKLPLFLCLVAFLATFVATRVITRLIRAGKGPFKDNVSEGGLHVHHAVPGVFLLIVGAFLSLWVGSESPWAEAAAILVGIGTSLVLDEFALILHLDDVYWSQEGRISVEMISLCVVCLGLVLVGASPFDFGEDDGTTSVGARVGIVAATLALHVFCLVVTVMKGKYKMALLGIFIPLLVYVSAIRLGRPNSRWAKRHYGERNPKKQAKAERRSAKWDARFGPVTGWLSDAVAGKPTQPTEPQTQPEPQPQPQPQPQPEPEPSTH